MSPILEIGDSLLLTLAGTPDGQKFRARVREVDGQVVAVRAPDCTFQTGDHLRVELIIPNDARYVLSMRLRANHNDLITLEPIGEWERVQRREFFRIRTGIIPAKVVRDRRLRTERDAKSKSCLVDLSAGGALVETDLPVEAEEQLQLRFELPFEVVGQELEEGQPTRIDVDVPGRVVRATLLSRRRRRHIAVRFGILPVALHTEILRWVYALQAKRRARELDAEFDDFL